MSDVIMIDNSIDQGSILVPVSTVQADFVTETGTIVYVPLASTHSPGIVTIGEGLLISPDGLLEFDRTEVTLKSLALNGKLLEPDENKHINLVLTKNDVGLDKVDNTADEDKPVSNATKAALNELDNKLTLNINNVNDDLVAHVNRVDNPHKVTKEQIGLGNVDNTSDINKPISRATKNELARIERLIKGAANIFSYDSYEALVEDVNPLDDSVFKVGQSVYIRTLNVPDLWVFSVEEEPVEFEYTTDADIENLLKTDGSFQVGYFKFAALETGKVNLDSYVTLDTAQTISGDKNYTGLLKLNDKPVAVKEDLDNYVTKDGYTMRASNNTVGKFYYNTGTGEKAIQLKMPTIPVTSVNGLTGDVVIDLSKYVTSVNGLTGDVVIDLSNYATSDALSAVTDATLSDDNKTLTITKRNGTSFDFQGGGGGSGVPRGTCETSSNTSTKDVVLEGFVLEKGAMIDVDFKYSNGGIVKLNVNNTGAIEAIYYEIGLTSYTTLITRVGADDSIPYGGWKAGDTVRFFYDGSNWIEVMNLTQGAQYSIPYMATKAKTATTQATTDNSTNIATTAFVKSVLPTSIDGMAGGTLASPLIITGGDTATASKIILNETNKGQITASGAQTLLGFNTTGQLDIGHSSYNLRLRGKEARFKYQNKDVAFYEDVTALANSIPDTSGFLTSASMLTKNYIVKGNNYLNVNVSGVQIDDNNNVVVPATSGFKISDRVSINYNSTRQALYISVL